MADDPNPLTVAVWATTAALIVLLTWRYVI